MAKDFKSWSILGSHYHYYDLFINYTEINIIIYATAVKPQLWNFMGLNTNLS